MKSQKFKVQYVDSCFLQTSNEGCFVNKLNWRCEILLSRNIEAIKGKRVLDLACHDGRFSYACLQLGAKSVTGVECRQDLVENVKKNLTSFGYTDKQFQVIQDDVLAYMRKVQSGEFDTILCFGYFYHTFQQIELLQLIKSVKPRHFILDTVVDKANEESKIGFIARLNRIMRFITKGCCFIPGKITLKKFFRSLLFLMDYSKKKKEYLIFYYEDAARQGNTNDKSGLVAKPSKGLLEMLFKYYGFKFRELQWCRKEIGDTSNLEEFIKGLRVTYIAELIEGNTK